MGIFIKLLLFLVVLALALPFVLKDKDGQPLMTTSKLKMPEMGLEGVVERLPFNGQAVPAAPVTDGAKDVSSSDTKIYSWRDKQGNMHFSNLPPGDANQVETMQIDPNRNVMKASMLPPEENPENKNIKVSEVQDVQSLYTPEGVNRLIEDARNVEGLLQQRMDEQNQLIDQR